MPPSAEQALGRAALAFLIAAAALHGCGERQTGPGTGLDGGVLATFGVSGEEFRVWVTSGAAIEQILALQDGSSAASIPNGALRPGPGRSDHNAPWSWHMDPVDVEMAELAIEVCDGRPSLVESLLDDYMAVGRFCPWSAELIEVRDLR